MEINIILYLLCISWKTNNKSRKKGCNKKKMKSMAAFILKCSQRTSTTINMDFFLLQLQQFRCIHRDLNAFNICTCSIELCIRNAFSEFIIPFDGHHHRTDFDITASTFPARWDRVRSVLLWIVCSIICYFIVCARARWIPFVRFFFQQFVLLIFFHGYFFSHHLIPCPGSIRRCSTFKHDYHGVVFGEWNWVHDTSNGVM